MAKSMYSSLQPNATYNGPNGAEYHTDQYGRVTHWTATVSSEAQPRNVNAQRTLEGKSPERSTAGHTLAASQGGSGEKFNMTAQNYHVNTRDYRAFERENDALNKNGSDVKLDGSNFFATSRDLGINSPNAYMVTRTVTDKKGRTDVTHHSWTNENMADFENCGIKEITALQNSFANPGAIIYDAKTGSAFDEHGAIIDLGAKSSSTDGKGKGAGSTFSGGGKGQGGGKGIAAGQGNGSAGGGQGGASAAGQGTSGGGHSGGGIAGSGMGL